jgi:adenylate cyclase
MSRGLDNFRRYMPAKLVRSLLDSGVVARLGGQRRTVSILFMDIEGFTTATERLGHRVVPLLGEYFSEMTDAIQRENGTIDKFIGDAVMAFWGAPAHDEEHPTQVCRAALACQARMEALRERWSGRKLPPLRVRVGVNTGRVVVGNIGAEERLSYTVVGEPVNLAAMLEAMNKEFGTGVLISQNTFELAKFDIVARRIDAVKLKGKREGVAIYELLAMRDAEGEAPAGFDWLDAYEDARAAYGERRWRDAAARFREVLTRRPDDPPSRVFLARCEERMAEEARPGLNRPAVLALSRQDGASEG